MSRDRVPDLEEILRKEAEAPIPEPRPDLPNRAIRKVHAFLLMTELVRWATLEGLWKSLSRKSGDARGPEERQDP